VNKKIFITFTILLAAIIIVSPMLATAEACGHCQWHREKPTVEVFTVEAYIDPSTITNMVEIVPPRKS